MENSWPLPPFCRAKLIKNFALHFWEPVTSDGKLLRQRMSERERKTERESEIDGERLKESFPEFSERVLIALAPVNFDPGYQLRSAGFFQHFCNEVKRAPPAGNFPEKTTSPFPVQKKAKNCVNIFAALINFFPFGRLMRQFFPHLQLHFHLWVSTFGGWHFPPDCFSFHL